MVKGYETKIFSVDSSLCRCTIYVDNYGGSLEKTCQTTVSAILVDSHASRATYVC